MSVYACVLSSNLGDDDDERDREDASHAIQGDYFRMISFPIQVKLFIYQFYLNFHQYHHILWLMMLGTVAAVAVFLFVVVALRTALLLQSTTMNHRDQNKMIFIFYGHFVLLCVSNNRILSTFNVEYHFSFDLSFQ